MAAPLTKAAAALGEHVQKQLVECHLFSDITICFRSKDYKLHRNIISQSSYFRTLLSGPWKESGKSVIELQIEDINVTVEGLEMAFSYMYGSSPTFSVESVMPALDAACFLGLENLCECCVDYMVQDISEHSFLRYWHLSGKLTGQNCYGRFIDQIRRACWTFLCLHASHKLRAVLPKLPLQPLCQLLRSNELWVPNETDRYKLAMQVLTDWKLSQLMSTNNSLQNYLEIGHKRLRQSDSIEQSDEEFSAITDLFIRGGIIYANMEATEILKVRTELKHAGMSIDAANDSIWQQVLLRSCLLHANQDDDQNPNVDDDDDSDSDGDKRSSKTHRTTMVSFSVPPEGISQDEKGRFYAGGFSWISKPDVGMQLPDFPPCRFGVEFNLKDKKRTNVSGPKVFYGGSMWTCNVFEEDGHGIWLFSIECIKPATKEDSYAYKDERDEVFYLGKMYMTTRNGLECVTGIGNRENCVAIRLSREQILFDKPTQVWAIVQLVDSPTFDKSHIY